MAHDIFDFDDAWGKNLLDEDEVIDLDEELRKQRQELLAQQWRDGELFVTQDYVTVYENPSDPSPIVCEFEPDTVILLASLKESHNYGGFRDVLLPIRGWIWTSVDEYDRAFYDASMMLKNVNTRETSTSMMRLGKFGMKQIRKLRPKKKNKSKRAQSSAKLYNATTSTSHLDLANVDHRIRDHSNDNLFNQSRDYAFSDADIYNPHIKNNRDHLRQKTNHLYVNNAQRQLKIQNSLHSANSSGGHGGSAADVVLPQPETPHAGNNNNGAPTTSLQIIQSAHPLEDHTSETFDEHTPEPPPPTTNKSSHKKQQSSGNALSFNYNNNNLDALSYASSRELSVDSGLNSREYSSKFRKMSHQVSYLPAAIQKIEKPISLQELDDDQDDLDNLHLTTDSTGHIKTNKILDTSDKKEEKKDEKGEGGEGEGEEKTDVTTMTEPEQQSLGSKIINSKIVRKTIHFVRSHPALLTLIYIGFCGFVEGIIFFDIITDILVAGALASAGYQGAFALSTILIITPYFIAWSSLWVLFDKKREQVNKKENNNHIIFKNKRRYSIFVTLFSFAPFGVMILILFDCWIVFEFIFIRPLYFCCRFKLFRSDTFEELGYRKLRRVSEVCSETLFQALVQLWIILYIKSADTLGSDFNGGGINVFEVTLSLIASFFVIILWFGIILRIESSSNGISLIEYIPIVLQGSFKFVPFLPAIEKGTKNGKKVNWCLFKFDLSALSALGKALGSPNCNLQIVKVSTKTVKKLPRLGCKFFGRLMTTALEQPITVVVSRLDRDLEDLFELFDPEDTKYFNFTNFCRATLALRAQDNEVLKYREISKIFYQLAAKKNANIEEEQKENQTDSKLDEKEKKKKNEQKVWLLDLMLKLRTSKEYISILDIEQPEDYCVKKNDVNLLTLCRAIGFPSINHEENVITAVCQNKLNIAHALTEDDGIPVVVEITEGMELLASYMNFHKPRTPISSNDDEKNGGFPDTSNRNNGMVRTNLDVVQQYHRLNRLRKSNGTDIQSPLDALNELFNDVSIYVSVAMCEIEKSTEATKETINQFWNEKLLFIIPYSVIEDIKNDATHTLARDTEHREHHPQLSSIYGLQHYPNHITGDTQFLSGYFTSGTNHDFPPIKLPYHQESNSFHIINKTPSLHGKDNSNNNNQNDDNNNNNNTNGDTSASPNSRHVTFAVVSSEASPKMSNIDIQNSKIEEDDNEENNEEDGAKHIKYNHENTQTTVVHIKTSTNGSIAKLQKVDSDTPNDEDIVTNNDNDDDDDQSMTFSKKKPSHHTGLTQKIESIFAGKLSIKTGNKEHSRSGTFEAEPVADSSPVITPEDSPKDIEKEDKFSLASLDKATFPGVISNSTRAQTDGIVTTSPKQSTSMEVPQRSFKRGSSLDPGLFGANAKLRGRESALRDSLHISKFKRQSSMKGIPHFEKKIYLDFNLFDDSGVNNNNDNNMMNNNLNLGDQPVWDFQPSVSTGSIKARKQRARSRRTKSNIKYKKSARNIYNTTKYKGGGDNRFDEDHVNSDSGDSIKSDSEEEKKNNFDVSTPRSPTALNDNAGIEGGEGTFLGSAHISININDHESLYKYHTIIREKEIKIGKKGHNKHNKLSKLKFKIYCNALAAYLEYGKNYGDKITEEELMQQQQIVSSKKPTDSPH